MLDMTQKTKSQEEDWFDQLEFSVRTKNVLSREGIQTMDAFMALTKPDVMSMKNAGARTWKEIQELQNYLKDNRYGEAHLLQCVGMVNQALYHGVPGVRLTINNDGFIEVYKRVT